MAGIEQFGRLNIWGMLRGMLSNRVAVFVNAGAPTDGTVGTYFGSAGPGSLLIDYTNGQLYTNTNTLASPTWSRSFNSVNIANVNVVGGVPVIHRITAAALTGDVDVVITDRLRVINVWAIGTAAGGVGDTIQVKYGANAITNALDMNVVDQTIVRAGTINDAFWDIGAAGTLRVTGASAVNAEVIVEGIRVA